MNGLGSASKAPASGGTVVLQSQEAKYPGKLGRASIASVKNARRKSFPSGVKLTHILNRRCSLPAGKVRPVVGELKQHIVQAFKDGSDLMAGNIEAAKKDVPEAKIDFHTTEADLTDNISAIKRKLEDAAGIKSEAEELLKAISVQTILRTVFVQELRGLWGFKVFNGSSVLFHICY